MGVYRKKPIADLLDRNIMPSWAVGLAPLPWWIPQEFAKRIWNLVWSQARELLQSIIDWLLEEARASGRDAAGYLRMLRSHYEDENGDLDQEEYDRVH